MNPTEQEILDLINLYIVANGNNEITANVLNPVLEAMVNQPNQLIGILSQLQTTNQSNLVSAINEVYSLVGGITEFGVQLHSGIDDPNTTPPSQYNIADFYIQRDGFNNPVQLWQYNGFYWIMVLQSGGAVSDYTEDVDYVDTNTFPVPAYVKGLIVFKNLGLLEKTEYTRTGNNVIINIDLYEGDVINFRGSL